MKASKQTSKSTKVNFGKRRVGKHRKRANKHLKTKRVR